jgi:hypothetical protein
MLVRKVSTIAIVMSGRRAEWGDRMALRPPASGRLAGEIVPTHHALGTETCMGERETDAIAGSLLMVRSPARCSPR